MKRYLPRILLVDDAPINIQVLNEALQGEYRTCFATSGLDALNVAKSAVPDLILLDIMMPGMDGYEVCRRLKSDPDLAAIPVIFVTALAQQDSEAIGLGLGAVDYISKPFNPDLVRLRVRNQLELKKQRDLLQNLNVELEVQVTRRTAALETAVTEMETLCYAISHELRAPLRHINAYGTMLAERCGPGLDDEARTDFSRLVSATIKVGNQVDALLSLPRLCRKEISHESVDLSLMAREVLGRLCHAAPQRSVEVVIAEGMIVSGDMEMLRVALGQLLENAWKFTAGIPAARIEVGREMNSGQAVYFVRDNGVGFDMAYADKLFGIFQRLHTESEFCGLGTGLVTAQRIIAGHNGEIWAAAQPGQGASFFFTLNDARLPQPNVEKEGSC